MAGFDCLLTIVNPKNWYVEVKSIITIEETGETFLETSFERTEGMLTYFGVSIDEPFEPFLKLDNQETILRKNIGLLTYSLPHTIRLVTIELVLLEYPKKKHSYLISFQKQGNNVSIISIVHKRFWHKLFKLVTLKS